jgi:hypothetical protein
MAITAGDIDRLMAAKTNPIRTVIIMVQVGRPIRATSRATNPMATTTNDINHLMAARTNRVRRVTMIMVQVSRPIGEMETRATRTNSRVITIAAGVGRVIIVTQQVGLNIQITAAVSFPSRMVLLSMRANQPVLMTTPPIAKRLFLPVTRDGFPGRLGRVTSRRSPIRAARPRIITIITIIVQVGPMGTHRVMITMPLRHTGADSRVMKMPHRIGVSLVLTRSLRVAIIVVRSSRLTGVELPAMSIINVIQIEAATTGIKSNLLRLPPGKFFRASRQSPSPGKFATTGNTEVEIPTVRERGLIIGTNHSAGKRRNLHMVGIEAGHRARQMSSPLLQMNRSRRSRRATLELTNHLA